jgi:hypothetical protein
MGERLIPDDMALNVIAELMNDNDWSPDTLDDIAQTVRMTGRDIDDNVEYEGVPDMESGTNMLKVVATEGKPE